MPEEGKKEENLGGCIRLEGKVYIPLDEIIRLCRVYGRLLARDLAASFEKASLSENIREVDVKEKP